MEFDYSDPVLKENGPMGATRQVDEGEIASRRSQVESSFGLVRRFAALGSGARLHPREFPLIALSTSASDFGCGLLGGGNLRGARRLLWAKGDPPREGTPGQL